MEFLFIYNSLPESTSEVSLKPSVISTNGWEIPPPDGPLPDIVRRNICQYTNQA
jgi:hypothetical protein